MYIFKISHEQINYDCNLGHVIVATNKAQVRELAKSVKGDELPEIWDKAPIEKIGEYTGLKKKPFIVLTDFLSA